MIRTEIINLKKCKIPEDYHCNCFYCRQFLGVLIRPDGTYYSSLDRRKYYSAAEKTHIAKTNTAIARFAIQQYTKPDDWVLDPTMGAGTTAVEALNNERNVAGVEIQYIDVIKRNIALNNPHNKKSIIIKMDARNIGQFLSIVDKKFSLIVNNPPYSGDENQTEFKTQGKKYDKDLKNLAFLKEKDMYYSTIADIYKQCIEYLKPGGYFVTGVKDMVRNKKPYKLHKRLCKILDMHLSYVGTVLLPHYPRTLFMNTYPKRHPNVKIPLYQTINIFRKEN